MTHFVFPQGLKVKSSSDYEQAKAFAAPAELVFTPSPKVKAAADHVRLSGTLLNPTGQDVDIIVFPTHSGHPLFASLVPSDRWSRPEPDASGPPMPPSVPPAPLVITVPARSEVSFEGIASLDRVRYLGMPEVEVEWTFRYWNEPMPRGRVKVTLPSR
jgi:hypothetical protein